MEALMNRVNYKKSILIRYGLIGVIFGMCFPIGAIIVESLIRKLPLTFMNILVLHIDNPLLYMIDTAPLFLGIFALVGGFSRSKAEVANENIASMLQDVESANENKQIALDKFEEETRINYILQKGIETSSVGLVKATSNLSDNVMNLTELGINVNDEIIDITVYIQEISSISERIVCEFNCFNDDSVQMHNEMLTTKEDLVNHIEETSYIVNEIEELARLLDGLAIISKEVVGITDIINNLSDDINLLAINASIEAARAGEEGKGFAVIATEIRKLSNQTNVSLGKITKQIQSVTKGIDESRKSMANINDEGKQLKSTSENVALKISALEHVVTKVRDGSSEITSEIKSQGKAIGSIRQMVESLSSSSHTLSEFLKENVKLIEQTDGDIINLQKHLKN
jgi:methyl-accepting chemotaxis protein